MELRHLRYFVAVAEELNFTRAAEKLRLAQPSLTRQIHNLEEELGVQLLDRSRNQVSLTKEGALFLTDARRLVALSLESVKAVQRFSRGESAQLNLGYLFKFNFDLLPATLTSFYQACPEISVNLFDMSPAEQIGALEARKIDLGFVGLRPAGSDGKAATLRWECVARHDVVAAMPAGHRLAGGKSVSIADLKSLFFVTMAETSHPGSREWMTSLCKDGGFAPRIIQEVDLESGLMTFIAEGLGVTLAREQIKNLPHAGVAFLPVRDLAKIEYWIAWHGDNHSKTLANYIDIVKAEAPAWN